MPNEYINYREHKTNYHQERYKLLENPILEKIKRSIMIPETKKNWPNQSNDKKKRKVSKTTTNLRILKRESKFN